MQEERLVDILDFFLVVEGNKEQMKAVAVTIMKCLKEDLRCRPCMREVEVERQGLINATNGATLSTQQAVVDSSRVNMIGQFHPQEVIDATNGASRVRNKLAMTLLELIR
ncbi:unnamed protein product [Cuscuta epithymum]|uniref:Uncharacterized protein n=1 Tax=Cuscuta epithymum TaxID=186058 RepID=A0AAV0EX05_9ASTE|nr:unnamed protein product [Cuscuta epithymum]